MTAVFTTVRPKATTTPTPKPVDRHSRIELRNDPHHRAVQREHAQPQRQHGEGQRHPDQERPDQRVDEADRGGRHERGLEVVDVEVRQQRAEQHQRARRDHEDHDDAPEL